VIDAMSNISTDSHPVRCALLSGEVVQVLRTQNEAATALEEEAPPTL